MHVYIYIYMCVCVCMYIYIYTYTQRHIHIWTCTMRGLHDHFSNLRFFCSPRAAPPPRAGDV